MNENKNIKIYKPNEAFIHLDCNPIIERELGNYFQAKAANYRFHPLYKQGIWDGTIQFYNTREGTIPIGLLNEVQAFARKGGYTTELMFKHENDLSYEQFLEFVKKLDPIVYDEHGVRQKPRKYQLMAAFDALKKKHLNMGSVTGSGKSLILYIIIRAMERAGKKTILVVPNVSLVEQMYSDFEDYGWSDVADKCHMIYSGQKKVFDCPVIISTWQSLYKNKELFQAFDCLLIDECHQAKAKNLKDIANACIRAEYRIGCTGTYPPYKTSDWFTIVGSTGPIANYSTYKELQEQGHIAKLRIYAVVLKYSNKFKVDVYNNSFKEVQDDNSSDEVKLERDFQKEVDLVNDNPARHRFIMKMVQNLNKNALVLFTKKEKHGLPLKELFSQELSGKKLIYIDGDVDPKERERMRAIVESRNDVALLATYGTLSTGINIKNIHHLIFASGYKSMVKVLQSIGRILRKHKEKDTAILYDIVDDLSFKDSKNGIRFVNYSMKHFKERIKIYEEQGFEWKIITFKIDDENV